MVRTLAALVLCALLATPASASAELLLEDGRVLSGSDLRRERENYLLTVEGGEVLTIPAGLVREVRLIESGTVREKRKPPEPERPPTGLREAEPEVLAGPPEPLQPPDTADQLRVLGPGETFARSVFDPWWYPSSDWSLDPRQNDFHPVHWASSILDPTWIPHSAFDAEADVLEPSRSTWMSGVLAFTWWPADSFAQPSIVFPPPEEPALDEAGPQPPETADDASFAPPPLVAQFTPAGRTTRPDGTVAAEACAREIFRALPRDAGTAGEPRVAPVDDPALAALGVPLHTASVVARGRTYRAVFTTGPGVCRLVAGDLEPLLGLRVDEQLAESHAARAVGQARADAGAPTIGTPAEKVHYGYMVVRLADPTGTGGESGLRLLTDRGQLERTTAEAPAACGLGARKRQREVERALAAFTDSAVVDGEHGEVVVFHTWSPAEGDLVRHAVRLVDGRLESVERRRVASHLGAHRDHESGR